MKRTTALILAACVALTLGACAGDMMSKDDSMKKEEMMKKEQMMKKEEMMKN